MERHVKQRLHPVDKYIYHIMYKRELQADLEAEEMNDDRFKA